MIGDSQLRWLGPEKGVMHMAIGAVVNAAWDLAAKVAGKPVWRLLADMTPEQVVALVDFRYLDDALTPDEALAILRARGAGRDARIAELERSGYPAYTTTPGWIGYSDEKLAALSRQAVADGFTQIKLKVGADIADDMRRMALARDAVGPDIRIAVDANQRWGVAEADGGDRRARALAAVLGRGADEPGRDPRPGQDPRRDRAGQDRRRRARRQPGDLQAAPPGGRGGRADHRRLPGGGRQREHRDPAARREVRRPRLPARGRRRPVRDGPAPRDVRLRRGQRDRADDRVLEYVDHLHEHFTDPVRVTGGRYLAPSAPGFSATLRQQSLRDYEFPRGAVWQRLAGFDTESQAPATAVP